MNALKELIDDLENRVSGVEEARGQWLSRGQSDKAEYCQGIVSGMKESVAAIKLYLGTGGE
jgi:hypothetical protein